MLAAFPVFAIIGLAVYDAPWRRIASFISGALLVVGAALFSSGYLIS
jgi:hypothetical protein